jgi:neutral amino acid transport system permease protein
VPDPPIFVRDELHVMVVQTFVFGVVTGSYLLVATLGFSLVSRVEKFMNIAHAELISLGAFTTYLLNSRAGWALPLAGLAAMAVVAIVAAVMSRLAYRPIRRGSSVVLMITSVGVLYVLHGLIQTVIGPGTYSYSTKSTGAIDLDLFRISYVDLTIVVLAAAAMLTVHLLLTRTSIGLQWRALATDEDLAVGRGVDSGRCSLALWLLVGALSGLAGVLLGLQGAINTGVSFEQILLILSVAILAGLGSVYGVVAAALLLGIAMDMSTLVIPAGYREAVAFGAVLLVLAFRPQGLSGARSALREA